MARRYPAKTPIVWKSDPKITGAAVLKPLPHYAEPALDAAHKGIIEDMLVPGQFFRIGCVMDVHAVPVGYLPHPFPVLERSYAYYSSQPTFAALNEPVIYAGFIRVEEMSHKNGLLRLVRHTFIVKAGRYIITDLNVLTW
jgi:hypothetical protein